MAAARASLSARKETCALPRDYLPANDVRLHAFVGSFVQELTPYLAEVGLAPDELQEIAAALLAFAGALAAQREAEAAYRRAVADKKDTRRALERTLRPLVQRVTHHPGMTDGLRARLGITVPRRGR